MKHFKTISEFHQFIALPKPQHPLISVIDVSTVTHTYSHEPMTMMMDFYSIAVKRMHNVKMRYGQQPFDFNEGVMSFMSPNQVFSMAVSAAGEDVRKSGWVIYIHPDFIWDTSLAKTIKGYDFWDYSLNEALLLSTKEEAITDTIRHNIEQELDANIDTFSKQIIISHIETLLNYSERFYHRQFITRDKAHHEILENLEGILDAYFNDENPVIKGLPTVHDVSDKLHLSPKYLSSLLKTLTGLNTQQHIHEKLIEKAKERLSTTNLTVSEIAYELGFEHLQSFSKLFKSKTDSSPMAFRRSFN